MRAVHPSPASPVRSGSSLRRAASRACRGHRRDRPGRAGRHLRHRPARGVGATSRAWRRARCSVTSSSATVVETGTAVRRIRPGDRGDALGLHRLRTAALVRPARSLAVRRSASSSAPERLSVPHWPGRRLSSCGCRSPTPPWPCCRPAARPSAALLIGDNLATGWVAVQRAALRPGDVVVIGGGAVGQLAAWPRRPPAPGSSSSSSRTRVDARSRVRRVRSPRIPTKRWRWCAS